MRVFLLCSVLALGEDPCAVVAKKGLATYQESIACYGNFQLSDEIRNSTINTLRKLVPVLTRATIEKTMLTRGLDNLLTKAMRSEFDFHMRLSRLFTRVGARYDAGCFATFRFQMPLELTIAQEGEELAVRVANSTSRGHGLWELWRILGIDPLDYRGRRVRKVNSREAAAFFLEYAGWHGTDFFGAFSRFGLRDGLWQRMPGSFASRTTPPRTAEVEFEFDSGETLRVPFLASIPPSFHDSFSFYTKLCKSELLAWPVPIISGHEGETTQPAPQVSPEHSALFVMGKGTAFLAIPRFDMTPEWERAMIHSLELAKRHAVEDLVVDLRDSGGANVCGSYHLLAHLFPEHAPRYSFEFPAPPIIQRAMAECWLSQPQCAEGPILPNVLGCNPSQMSTLPASTATIRILTNGNCSGACAILFHGLLDSGVTHAYFHGPLPYQQPLGRSGIPYSLRQLWDDLHYTMLNPSAELPPLWTRANLHFTLGGFRKTTTHALDTLLKNPYSLPLTLRNQMDPVELYAAMLLADK